MNNHQSPSESDDASQMESADVNSEVRDSSPEGLSGVERFVSEVKATRYVIPGQKTSVVWKGST